MFTDKRTDQEAFLDEFVTAEQINRESTGEAICALFVTLVCGAIVGVAALLVHCGG
jgi:hypothetical protein